MRTKRPTQHPLDVEVVIPVYNEQTVLAASINHVHAYLSEHADFSWQIAIADNASTDDTEQIGRRLAESLASVRYLRLERKGRGLALREAWSSSAARVRCYMDVDLSTDLRALPALLAPVLSGHSQLAIGTRLHRGARVTRCPRRELISRAYNRLLRAVLRARFSDAQCGFKAISAAAAAELVPQIADNAWFFDTELLILAQRSGLRIHEVPVDWVEDADSRVHIWGTVRQDLKGVVRLAAASRGGRFAAIGALSTLLFSVLYLLLCPVLCPTLANAGALALSAVANTSANRRITYRIRGTRGMLTHQLQGALVFAFTLLLSSASLWALGALSSRPPRLAQLAALIAGQALATLSRFALLERWVFAGRARTPDSRAPEGHAATLTTIPS